VDLALPYGFLLIFLRTAGLIMAAPVTSESLVPSRVRLALAAAVAGAAFLGAGAPSAPLPGSILAIIAAGAGETLLGGLAGLGARWVLAAAESAGQLAGFSMGLGYGASVSPSGADSAAISQLFRLLALSAAVALGAHREGFAWLCRSVRQLPPGTLLAENWRAMALHAVGQATLGMGLAVRIAFPGMAAATAAHAALGLASRFSPQLNLQSVGFSLAIFAGGAALYLFAPAALELVARQTVLAASHG
jgi:flagellar biosynthesis protein FliR